VYEDNPFTRSLYREAYEAHPGGRALEEQLSISRARSLAQDLAHRSGHSVQITRILVSPFFADPDSDAVEWVVNHDITTQWGVCVPASASENAEKEIRAAYEAYKADVNPTFDIYGSDDEDFRWRDHREIDQAYEKDTERDLLIKELYG